MAVLNLAVDEGDEATTWVKVLAFEANAEACRGPEQGTKLYAEGRLKLESWEGRDGVQRSGLTVLARVAQPIGAIGRRRRKTHRAPQERRNPAAGADDGFDWARGDPIPDLVP